MAAESSSSRKYVMVCPHCETRLKVEAKDVGTKRACPRCQQQITIGKKSAPPSAAPQDEFGISCKLCGTRFFASPSQVGQKVDCPDCLTEHIVPPPPPQPEPVAKPIAVTDDGDEYQLQPLPVAADRQVGVATGHRVLVPPAANPVEKTFHIRCSLCGTTLVARHQQIGKSLPCPDCGSRVEVKIPPKKSPQPTVVARDPKIGVTAAADLAEQRKHAQRVMAEAAEHQAINERQRPIPPRRPFLDGVYGYPFMPRVLSAWVFLVPLAMAIAFLVLQGVQMNGSQQMGALFMFVLAAFFSIGFLLLLGNGMMTLLNTTALGYPQPEEWPRFDFWDALGSAVYLFNAAFVSLLPVMILGALDSGGVAVTDCRRPGFCLVSILFDVHDGL